MDLLTINELAKTLSLSSSTIHKYASQGKIPAIRIGKIWRFQLDAVIEHFQQPIIAPVEIKRGKPGRKRKIVY